MAKSKVTGLRWRKRNSIWMVGVHSYTRRGSSGKLELHGWHVYSHGKLIAKRTGFATFEAAEAALVTLTLLLSEWRRQSNRRKRVARGARG